MQRFNFRSDVSFDDESFTSNRPAVSVHSASGTQLARFDSSGAKLLLSTCAVLTEANELDRS